MSLCRCLSQIIIMKIMLVQLKNGDTLRIYDGETASGNLLFDETDMDKYEPSINSTGYVRRM